MFSHDTLRLLFRAVPRQSVEFRTIKQWETKERRRSVHRARFQEIRAVSMRWIVSKRKKKSASFWSTDRLPQSLSVSTIMPLVTSWITPREQGLIVGLAYAGINLANAATYPITAAVCSSFGWRSIFYLAGQDSEHLRLIFSLKTDLHHLDLSQFRSIIYCNTVDSNSFIFR